jgi:hypothetical protein
MTWGWESPWRRRLETKGYTMTGASHSTDDSSYGWTILFAENGTSHELTARTTAAMSREIKRLPTVVADAGQGGTS